MHTHRPTTSMQRGFTLIELMVVILIIAILAAISIAVASRVTESGKQSASTEIVRTLEAMTSSYAASRDGQLPKTIVLDPDASITFVIPLVDGRYADRSPTPGQQYSLANDRPQPTTLLLLIEMERNGYAEALKGIDTKFVRQVSDADAYGWRWDPVNRTARGTLVPADIKPARTVVDAWGRPIRFVHPAYDGGAGDFFPPNGSGATSRGPMEVTFHSGSGPGTPDEAKGNFSRSFHPFEPGATGLAADAVGDADEGLCPGNSAYFYSAGSDGDPGTREDNAYTTRPTFPEKTKEFN